MLCRRIFLGILGICVGCFPVHLDAWSAQHAPVRASYMKTSSCRMSSDNMRQHVCSAKQQLLNICSSVENDIANARAAMSGFEKSAMCAIAAVSVLLASPTISHADFTQEQALAADVWSVVDATFVDRTFNNHDWMKLRQNVVKRDYTDRQQAYDAISKDLLEPLGDKYTRFIDPVKFEALRNSIVSRRAVRHSSDILRSGRQGARCELEISSSFDTCGHATKEHVQVSGIGVTLSVDKQSKLVQIVDVLDASPAAEAGLKRGSLVVEVDGIRTDDGRSTPDDVAALLRGPTATQAKLKLRLPGSQEEREMTLERRKVAVKPVTAGMNGKTR
eukprot:766375-Hanusia_phi.AAC.1